MRVSRVAAIHMQDQQDYQRAHAAQVAQQKMNRLQMQRNRVQVQDPTLYLQRREGFLQPPLPYSHRAPIHPLGLVDRNTREIDPFNPDACSRSSSSHSITSHGSYPTGQQPVKKRFKAGENADLQRRHAISEELQPVPHPPTQLMNIRGPWYCKFPTGQKDVSSTKHDETQKNAKFNLFQGNHFQGFDTPKPEWARKPEDRKRDAKAEAKRGQANCSTPVSIDELWQARQLRQLQKIQEIQELQDEIDRRQTRLHETYNQQQAILAKAFGQQPQPNGCDFDSADASSSEEMEKQDSAKPNHPATAPPRSRGSSLNDEIDQLLYERDTPQRNPLSRGGSQTASVQVDSPPPSRSQSAPSEQLDKGSFAQTDELGIDELQDDIDLEHAQLLEYMRYNSENSEPEPPNAGMGKGLGKGFGKGLGKA